jgi:hypothetical protein
MRFRLYSHDGRERRSTAVEACERQTERCHLFRASRVRGGAGFADDHFDNGACETMKDLDVAVLYEFRCGVRIGSREDATGSGRLAACCPSALGRSLSPSDRTVQRRVGTMERRDVIEHEKPNLQWPSPGRTLSSCGRENSRGRAREGL